MSDSLMPDVSYEDYLANTRAQMERDRGAFTGERPVSPGMAIQREIVAEARMEHRYHQAWEEQQRHDMAFDDAFRALPEDYQRLMMKEWDYIFGVGL